MAARERILEFMRTLSQRHRVFGALHVLATHALVWAVGLVIVDYAAPAWRGVFVIVAGGALAVVGAANCLRRQPRLAAADRELRLQDRLLTYAGLGSDVGGSRAPMRDWLEQDLDGRLQAVPPQQTERLWRRPLGRARYLIPLLVLLLLMRLLAPALPPIRPTGPVASNQGPGGGGNNADAGSESSPGGGDAPPPPQPEPQPDAVAAPEPEPGPPQTLPPKALIELAPEQKFVVPDFIGAGEGRRMLARVAEIGNGESQPAAAGDQSSRPPETPRDFEHARERALRARHVSPTERDFVKRYFDALVRQGK